MANSRRAVSFFEAMMLIVGSVVGAGVLGIPYVVSQVGFGLGVVYLVVLGAVSIGLHLVLGEVTLRTKKFLQIGGLAEKYIGPRIGTAVKLLVVLMGASALVAYVIGMGQAAYAIFADTAIGFTPYIWSIIFWAFGSLIVAAGLRTLAHMEFVFASIIFLIMIIIAGIAAPSVAYDQLTHVSFAHFFLPYGVILFAFHGTVAIPQVEELLPKQQRRMKRAILYGGAVPIVLYLLFTWAVVGVTGVDTTPIATIGLGEYLGPGAIIFGNLFALFAMITSFFGIGLALRRTFEWDFKLPPLWAIVLTLGIPLGVFLLGLRDFIATIGIAGALFGSLEALIIIVMFWKSRSNGDMPARAYALHWASFLIAILAIVFLIGGVYGVLELLA